MAENNNSFVISDETRRQRKRNILWGLGLSGILALLIAFGHYRYPETYNDLLLWSVVGFVIVANVVNLMRHRRYLRLIEGHRVEVSPGKILFWTNGERSELDLAEVVAMNLYRRKDRLRHIQLLLKSNRGIRLEGYGDLDRMADSLRAHIPAAHVTERRL